MVRDNRHDSAYLFGAICPDRAIGAAIIMPEVNAEAMGHHLKAIGAGVAPGPMENVRHYLRESILCSRVWDAYDDHRGLLNRMALCQPP